MVPIIGKLLHFSASKSLFFFITSSDSERNKHRSYPILLSCWCSKSWGQFCCMSLIADELLILIFFVHAQYGAVSGFIWPTFEGIAGWLKFCESSHRWGTCPPKLLMLKLLCLLKDLSSPLGYMCVCVCVTLELVFTRNMSSIASMKGSDCSVWLCMSVLSNKSPVLLCVAADFGCCGPDSSAGVRFPKALQWGISESIPSSISRQAHQLCSSCCMSNDFTFLHSLFDASMKEICHGDAKMGSRMHRLHCHILMPVSYLVSLSANWGPLVSP